MSRDSDIAVAFREHCKHLKEVVHPKRSAKYEPLLIESGAVKKSDGIYELNGWLCYPTKGFAMNKANHHKRTSITKVLIKQKIGE
ncbi:MAG: hypothetical protein EOL95_09345 [Bacteroidia bacterium]|nr:hypothetical protein [Bacteroidia bacterium]